MAKTITIGDFNSQKENFTVIDIEKYSTVVIYCQPFGAYFANPSVCI